VKEIYLQKQKEKKKGIETFLPKVKDKEVEIILLKEGASFRAKILAFSKYELLIELSNGKKMILFKHSIFGISLNGKVEKE
jgi:sRNA-binding regulator protein Hfq